MAAGDYVLDVGCGEGRHCINSYLEAPITALGIDLNRQDLTTAQQRFTPFAQIDSTKCFQLLQANAQHLPFATHSIDKIICSEVLEHIEHYENVIDEIYRILKPNGLLAVSVPRAWPEKICWHLSREYHQVKGGHIRIFDSKILQQEIESKGFSLYQKHWAHALHSPFWWLKCALWKHQETSTLIALYHRLLVWDLMQKPWITQTLERVLNPVMGKSVIMYFKKKSP
jgi:ubiquinone/menaquinone biosynthesis C-methylase UbiE